MPELPSMFHCLHTRAFYGNLLSSVKVSFPFLCIPQVLWLLQSLLQAPHLSISICLTGSRFLLYLPTPKPWVPVSNWAQVSFLHLELQLPPSLPYRLTYFIFPPIKIFVVPGLLSATCNNLYAVSILALFLLDLDSFHVYFYFQCQFPVPPAFALSCLSAYINSLIRYLFSYSWCFLSYVHLCWFLHNY